MDNNLLTSIEELRRKLWEFAKDRELTDPEVVEISQSLDRLLNQYYASLKCRMVSVA